MDPEEIYAEVLKEEQAKGSAAPVAEGRAKAARQRAAEGSPHPKEAKWWAGAQPHLDGGEAPAAEAAPAEAEPEAAPEREPEAAPEPEPAPQPAAEAAPAPAEPAPAAAPAAAPVAAAPVAAAPPAPAGVTHGTPTGNRMRPEDGVATEAQLQGQQAMYDRRKLIDDLVATGVPSISAADAGRRSSPGLAVMYIVIVLLAVFVIVQNSDGGTEPAGAEAPAGEGGGEAGGEGGGLTVVAANVAFDTDTIELTAGEPTEIQFNNEDSLEHNISIYETAADGTSFTDALFEGEIIPGGDAITYSVPALEAGEKYFQCDVHPNMNGTASIK